MKTYFDSSVLIAAMVAEEIHHERGVDALSDSKDGFTCNHALSEVFATLTGGRLNLQLSPAEAAELIENNVANRLAILDLSTADYRKAIVDCQSVDARGGGIFDMLHLQAARRGKAARIFTINVRHFQTFAPDLSGIIRLPS
ncbi:MAG TPA: type II toxin-antitoxin system VapC family toxin [Verrucomicrobiae bacterium]|nr:type II toxin-antitoxin system VapC family toxin [Verrucomicrobiae bacterium]